MHPTSATARKHIGHWATAAILLAGCSTAATTAPVNDEFSLRSGTTAVVENVGVRVRFLGVVSDSRCPINALCIWAGNAQVELEVRAGTITDTLLLNTFDGAKEGVVGDYRIKLVSLTPLPRAGEAIEKSAYQVTLIVVPVGVACTEEARPGLSIMLTDSLVPSVNDFRDIAVTAVDGSYQDSRSIPSYSEQPYYTAIPLAYERGGTYTVTVHVNGYKTWTKSGINVPKDRCHVVTVPITVRLAK